MDENKQAILLLAAQFSRPVGGAPTPLTAIEYGRFAAWLRHAEFTPKDLFHQFDEVTSRWQDPKNKITKDRLQYLLGRGMAMGVAIEKWQSAGIWILTRADREYPKRLKNHLSETAPPVLFGVGEQALLNAGGLAMVGSRDIGSADTELTRIVARQAALEGLNLVSGGARGVDELAMLAALEAEGCAVGVLANDLFKSALAGKWRKHLKSRQLALVTPFYPEGRFQVGNAMSRNKYIYCLSDFALVVRSDKDKGGTWTGAAENLKKQWIPLFVASPSDAEGNAALASMGATPLSVPDNAASDWLQDALGGNEKVHAPGREPGSDLIREDPARTGETAELEMAPAEPLPEISADSSSSDSKEAIDSLVSEHTIQPEPEPEQTYDEFMRYVSEQIIENGEVRFSDLKEQRKDLNQKQIREWLDHAVDVGSLKRKGRLLSYTSNVSDMDQQGFNFE